MTTKVEPVRKEVVVKGSRERAFRLFTTGIDRWWPREHHIGSSPMREMKLEAKVGGRWFALCEDGSECEVGRVLACEPGERLLLAWQITGKWAYDASFTTEVEIRFSDASPGRTRVTLEHRDLERYGEAANDIRAQLDDPKGWLGSLERMRDVGERKGVVLYEAAADVLEKAPLHFAAHKARLDVFRARGDLLAVGTWADPREGSMAVFATREAAEEFVREDPFVLEGVVSKATIRDWNESLL
jgi:uncharacterized protein YciI/uncharacterized protein YndB with AHSA1/START domain